MTGTRLTPEQIEDIITAHMQGESARALAARYGVARSSITHHVNTAARRRAEQRRNTTPPVYPQGQAVQGDWVDQAQCGGADMYPTTRSRGAGLATTEEAYMLQICKPCPVKAQCLEAGWGDPYGIWGGTTPAQRRSLLRKRSRRAAS